MFDPDLKCRFQVDRKLQANVGFYAAKSLRRNLATCTSQEVEGLFLVGTNTYAEECVEI